MKTLRETFDLVVEGAAKQGFRISVTDGVCRYRSDAGLKCNAGLLIPDNEYRSEFEGVRAIWLKCPSLKQHHQRLLMDLQNAHDRAIEAPDPSDPFDKAGPAEKHRQNLHEVAVRYNLRIPEVLK